MTVVLAIDPGTTQAGWVLWDGEEVLGSGVQENGALLERIRRGDLRGDRFATEMVASYGMAVGREVFETCVWIGRFVQVWASETSEDTIVVYRQEVKLHLCGQTKAKDANVRQAIIDLFPRTGGGKTPQIGTKSNPGPLFGVSSHAWPALGVAMVAMERIRETARDPRKRPAPRRVKIRRV